jgi:dolichol-phosphate mannosyltransferase
MSSKEKKFSDNNPLLVSIITPAFNEADNIIPLYEQLADTLKKSDYDWEWIIVDDHSSDDTYLIVEKLVEQESQIRTFRFSRNYGSHMALRCGFEKAKGDCAICMAADLQDPPSVIPDLIEKWESGTQVVWASRGKRIGESKLTVLLSRIYLGLMRNFVGLKNLPTSGADFFLLDRKVIDSVNNFSEKNTSILSLITWMGFRQDVITYDKQARLHGKSGWDFEKKFKMAIDSLTSFSFKPIRAMTIVGFVLSFLSFIYLIVVIINGFRGVAPQGWPSLMVAILFIGGLQIMMIGILGEYIWRSLDESRRRPKYTIETSSDKSE